VEEIGLDTLKSKVTRPSTDLKVGPFYGCYIIPAARSDRDSTTSTARHISGPRHRRARRHGHRPTPGSHKCCGFRIITMNTEASLQQAGRHLGDAKDADADCPGRRARWPPEPGPPAAARQQASVRELDMPVLHLPQLVGLALGLRPQGARLQRTS